MSCEKDLQVHGDDIAHGVLGTLVIVEEEMRDVSSCDVLVESFFHRLDGVKLASRTEAQGSEVVVGELASGDGVPTVVCCEYVRRE